MPSNTKGLTRKQALFDSGESFIEIDARGKNAEGLDAKLRAAGHPICGVNEYGEYPGKLFVILNKPTEEQALAIQATLDILDDVGRPDSVIKEDIEKLLMRRVAISSEPEIYATELAEIETKLLQLKQELGK